MSNPLEMTVHIADYPQVKAVLDAAYSVCHARAAEGWGLDEAITELRDALTRLQPYPEVTLTGDISDLSLSSGPRSFPCNGE